MGKHLVLAGCGHAHLMALLNCDCLIQAGHHVTVISPSPYHYYSGMGPGLLSGIYRPEEVRFFIQKTAEDRGAQFVTGYVERIDPQDRSLMLRSGETLTYDVVSFNTGSFVPMPEQRGEIPDIFPVKPIEKLWDVRQKIQGWDRSKKFICVIGGGAAAVEMAGGAWRAAEDCGKDVEVRLFSGRRLLSDFPARARKIALASFKKRSIQVKEGIYIDSIENKQCVSRSGEKYPCDLALIAVGIKPSPVFRNSGMNTDQDGALLVNRYLQSVDFPEIFGGGDCVGFEPRPLDKVGVYATRQNPVLLHNLEAAVEGRSLRPFQPQQYYHLLFNLGDDTAISCRRGLVWNGRLSFRLKDRIDRKFMQKFQVSGELHEDPNQVS